MSYITHFKKQPVNVQYWDYYILCRLNTDATIALQRMEYWDGTKEDGNIHAENINDALIQQGQTPTQDTGNWIYKSGDELHWELMGATGERRLPKLLSFLIDDVQYLAQRNNPINTWDRKKQYCFQRRLIQQHINYLGYIIDYFDLPMSRMTPVFYAIEKLTAEKCYIDTISVVKVLEMLEMMKTDEKLPHFLKNELAKFTQTFSRPDFIPFRNFAEWIAQNCGMHSAKTRDRYRKIADSIPQNCGSNSIEDKHNKTNIEDKHNKDVKVATAHASVTTSSTSISLSEKKEEKEIATSEPTTEQGVTPPKAKETAARRSVASRKPAKVEKTITLSPEAQEVYEEWCKMPWFKVKPELTETLAAHCEVAKHYKPTAEIMLKVKNDATSAKNDKKGFYKGKGWNFKFMLNELPQWLATNDPAINQGGSQSAKASGLGMSHDEAMQLVADVLEQTKQAGYSKITATAYAQDGVWLIRVVWEDGSPIHGIKSREMWNKVFKDNVEMDLEDQMKGAK
jgi:hypothetical protein